MTSSSLNKGWQEGKTLNECMLQMLEREKMCDVTFVVGETKVKVKAHKYMLASRSPVFDTMFEGSCPEKGDVMIPDVDFETFQWLLRYIYSDALDITMDNVNSILYVAEKYMLTSVKAECTRLLSQDVNFTNVIRILHVTTMYDMGEIREKCIEYLKRNTLQCIQEPTAVKATTKCMEVILKLDQTNCEETDLCRYFLKWASHRCELEGKEASGRNMRAVSGELLFLVRFPVIDKKYFAQNITELGILSAEEIIGVFKSHYGTSNCNFLDEERKLIRQNLEIFRHGTIINPWCAYGDERCDAISFKISEPVLLTGVVMYGPTILIDSSKSEVKLRILKDDTTEIFQQTFHSNLEPCELQTFKFDNVVQISKNNPYSIVISTPKYNSFYGRECKKNCTVDNVHIEFMSSQHSKTCTKDSMGQIAGITLSK